MNLLKLSKKIAEKVGFLDYFVKNCSHPGSENRKSCIIYAGLVLYLQIVKPFESNICQHPHNDNANTSMFSRSCLPCASMLTLHV